MKEVNQIILGKGLFAKNWEKCFFKKGTFNEASNPRTLYLFKADPLHNKVCIGQTVSLGNPYPILSVHFSSFCHSYFFVFCLLFRHARMGCKSSWCRILIWEWCCAKCKKIITLNRRVRLCERYHGVQLLK